MLFLGVLEQYFMALMWPFRRGFFTEEFPSRSWDGGFRRSFHTPRMGGGMFAADVSYCVFKEFPGGVLVVSCISDVRPVHALEFGVGGSPVCRIEVNVIQGA